MVRLSDGRLRRTAGTSLAGAMLKTGTLSVLEVLDPGPRCELQPSGASTPTTAAITW